MGKDKVNQKALDFFSQEKQSSLPILKEAGFRAEHKPKAKIKRPTVAALVGEPVLSDIIL